MKAVILAAGEGTRLRPLTLARPKPMLPVANQPLLEHVVDAVREAGINEVVFVVGYERERIQSYFGDGDDWGIDIEYAVQEKQLGTGHALLQAEPYVDGEFVALNGDRILDPSAVSKVVDAHRDRSHSVMAVTRVEEPTNYGVVEFDGRQVTSIEEKPPTHAVSADTINAGVYALEESIFDDLRSSETDGELAITTTLREYAARGDLTAVRFDGLWLDVSYLWDLVTVNAQVIDQFGAPRGDSASAHDESTVADAVALGGDVRVRPSAVVLPGTALGDNVEIGANATVSNAVVLPDATIKDGAVVKDCIVGANASVGPNTTIEGGNADVVVDGEVHEDVRLGGVLGDNTSLGGAVAVAPGSVLGNEADVESGAVVDGYVEDGAVVRRG
ncbi:NTP transferase domain-containing protein [Halobacterium sp. KA-4]|uniref:sugar phosphate nucleotidyltransferase n=1 Tax=Halobacterium sp. KA-4 TaxID=2896367 RepID=UPI001E401FB8|nr:sugar phosphate nucleotidyltransferase [Halobacterium sp. KA-4]MCD2200477.1 NTP transferase domain-containing protein [Halobacterium sp. KA-4]